MSFSSNRTMYRAYLSRRFIMTAVLSASCLGFFMGKYSRARILNQIQGIVNDRASSTISHWNHKQKLNTDRLNRIQYIGISHRSPSMTISYNEALVHPAMLLHENPQNVAVIGRRETLCEVLKYNTVQQVATFNLMRAGPNSDSPGCSPCLDDPRVKVFHEDAVAWFTKHFGKKEDNGVLFDVIIMDTM